MVDVSAEWVLNQNSINQKQGYVIITITLPSPANPVVISTLAQSGRTLKSLKHKRAYDPLGLSLPHNNIIFELYNFDGQWTYLYNNYEYDHLPIKIEYGYCLSQNETITGGHFLSRKIQKNDDIISIEACSSLELWNTEVAKSGIVDESDFYLLETPEGARAPITNPTAEDLAQQFDATKASELFSVISDKGVNCVYDTSIGNQDVLVNPGDELKLGDAIQYITNLTLARCIISRTDNVVFDDSAVQPFTMVKLLNQKSKPQYERSNQLKNISLKYNKINTEKEAAAAINYRHGTSGSKWGYSNDVYYRDYIIDYGKASIKRLAGDVLEAKRGMIAIATTTYVEEYGCSVVSTTGEYARGFTVIMRTRDMDVGNQVFITQNLIETEETSEDYNENGITCDITNPYGKPADLDKIADYFANRDLYTLNMRGDPSIDVGDYVWLSLENDDDFTTYKKALVLESELTFDGSFKDNMKVRIIDTDFETITGNTHEELSEYTHSQLAEYTHKQLMTEAI